MNKFDKFKNEVESVKVGDTFYFNAVAGTVKMVGYIREAIRNGTIRPVPNEVKKIVNVNDIETIVDIMNGDVICPQMDYEKLK